MKKEEPELSQTRAYDKELYLREDRYDNPKEVSKTLAQMATTSGLLRPGNIVRDFGCAGGEFLYYLSSICPEAHYYGYDIQPELVLRARERVLGVEFQVGSVLDEMLLPEGVSDISYMLGVHTYFDDFEPSFRNLLRWTRKGGRIYILGLFNPFPVDVQVHYSLADGQNAGQHGSSWIMFSKRTVSKWLDTVVGFGKHTFVHFEMPFDLPPHPDDPIRTWTFMNSQNRRIFTNGLSLICNLEILEIRP